MCEEVLNDMSSELLFKNQTVVGKDGFVAFNKRHSRPLMIFYIILALIVVGIGVIYLIKDLQDSKGIGYIVAGIVILVAFPKFFERNLKKDKYQSTFNKEDVLSTYEFYGDKIKVIDTRKEEVIATNNLSYDSIQKAVFDKEYIYLYISAIQAYILKMNRFKIGNTEKFKAFLQEKGIKVK